MCVCVSVDRQSPHLAFKTLQNQYIWASYDTLEKTIILSFAEKASCSQEKRLAKALDCTYVPASMGNPL